MKKMEEHVRKIEADGLLWGAAKLVPLAFGIHKLQISCVVEDDKVSIDWLTEQLEALEDYVSDEVCFSKAFVYICFFLTDSKCGYCCVQQNLICVNVKFFLIYLYILSWSCCLINLIFNL